MKSFSIKTFGSRGCKLRCVAACVAVAAMLAACGGLSEQEKRMVGKYYIPTVSDTYPLLELKNDRTAVMRALRPGELSFFVEGVWEVENDSLIIANDTTSVTIELGDPSLVGTVAERVSYPILGFDDNTLRIEKQGVVYDYHRRME